MRKRCPQTPHEPSMRSGTMIVGRFSEQEVKDLVKALLAAGPSKEL